MIEWLNFGKPSALEAISEIMAGLGTISVASGSVGPGGARIIGLCAAIICYYGTEAIKQKYLIDDTLDVFPLHSVGGILGTLFAGIFASNQMEIFSGQG